MKWKRPFFYAKARYLILILFLYHLTSMRAVNTNCIWHNVWRIRQMKNHPKTHRINHFQEFKMSAMNNPSNKCETKQDKFTKIVQYDSLHSQTLPLGPPCSRWTLKSRPARSWRREAESIESTRSGSRNKWSIPSWGPAERAAVSISGWVSVAKEGARPLPTFTYLHLPVCQTMSQPRLFLWNLELY